jgi:hypothetical protein
MARGAHLLAPRRDEEKGIGATLLGLVVFVAGLTLAIKGVCEGIAYLHWMTDQPWCAPLLSGGFSYCVQEFVGLR